MHNTAFTSHHAKGLKSLTLHRQLTMPSTFTEVLTCLRSSSDYTVPILRKPWLLCFLFAARHRLVLVAVDDAHWMRRFVHVDSHSMSPSIDMLSSSVSIQGRQLTAFHGSCDRPEPSRAWMSEWVKKGNPQSSHGMKVEGSARVALSKHT
jgi:hypothetical protein